MQSEIRKMYRVIEDLNRTVQKVPWGAIDEVSRLQTYAARLLSEPQARLLVDQQRLTARFEEITEGVTITADVDAATKSSGMSVRLPMSANR